MEAALRRGYEPVGMEPSIDIAPAGQTRTGRPVQIGILEQAPYAAGTFDAVTLFDVLEHTTDPRASLREIARVLRGRGSVAIRVPDHDGLLPRVSHWMAALSGGRFVQAIRLLWRFHRWGFNRRSLEELLAECGFQVVTRYGEDAQDLAAMPRKHWARNRAIVLGVRGIIALSHLLGMRDEIVVIARKTA
jgi:SAM-dependent methyltransferase